MGRGARICICICFCILLAIPFQTAMDPEDFSGVWYSAEDQDPYLFREGLIYNEEHAVPVSASEGISGAYSCGRDSAVLFVRGVEGLEKERELYLVFRDHGSFLCENPDGTGQVYFIRYAK